MEYTLEQLNFFRLCYIAFNLVPEGLRKVFKLEWDFLYKTAPSEEWKDTPQNGLDFYNKESRKSRTKNARYLATIQKGNTAEWDCTCLFFAILFSDSIGSCLSPAVFNDVDVLRQVRNGVAHFSDDKLTEVHYQNYVKKVKAAFISLKLPIGDIEEVENQTSFPTAEVNNLQAELLKAKSDLQEVQNTVQRKEKEVEALTQEINSRIESFCSLAFKPSHQIIKRSNDVTKIMKKMEKLENESAGAVSTIYLSGIPGCGKSQIARQIGQEYFDKRSCESEGLTFVATLNAETSQTLADSFLSLARRLGVTEYTLTNLTTSKVGRPKETIQHLKLLICPKMKQLSNWLIIADNVVDLSLVRNDLPPSGSKAWGNGQVLITTLDCSTIPSNAPHTFHKSLSQGMQMEDAVELLKEVSQIRNHEEVEKVAEVLEYQPLALAAAAVHVQTVVSNGSPNYGWKSYMETFVCGKREATEEPLVKQNAAYSTTMTTAIKMAIARASESDEVLRQAFCCLSLSAKDALPVEALVNFVKICTTEQTEELIRAKILKSSFIICLHGEGGAPEYLRVHNIVHEVLKTICMSGVEFTDRVRYISAAIKTFHSLIKAEEGLLKWSGHACAKLHIITSHCKALHEIITTDAGVEGGLMKELAVMVILWLCSAVRVCFELSNPSQANAFSKSAVDFVKYLSSTQKGDLLKGEVYTARGDALRLQRKYELALSYYEEAVAIYKGICGEEHKELARLYTKLGIVHRALGKLSRAKEYLEKSLYIKKATGSEHAGVAIGYSNLALVYIDLGEHNQAKKYYEKALVIQEKIYGEEHADTAAIYSNLGNACSKLGLQIQAKECHEKALRIRKKIYGEEHPDVATSYHSLGMVYRELGQLSRAKEYLSKSLFITKTTGSNHACVARGCSNLALVYSDLEEHNQAKKYYENALVIQEKIYGEEHADTAAIYSNLGNACSKLGLQIQAKECHEKALSIRKKIYGEEHSDVARSYHNLAFDYREVGQHNHSKECDEKALSIRKTIYGEKHSDVTASYLSLAFDYRELGKYKEAKQCNEKALVISKKIYDLACDYRELGQHSQAIECEEKALSIRKTIYGEEHPDVVASYHNLGVDYSNLGQHNQAKECEEKVLEISKKIYGEEHPEVANSYHILAYDYRELEQHNEAKECDEKALVLRKTIYGEKHPEVATSYHSLAFDYLKLGHFIQAKECEEKALSIRKHIYAGEEHPEVADGYHNLACHYRKLGQHNQAKECDEKALSIRKKIYGEKNPDVVESYHSLAFDYSELGNHNQAKECEKKALFIRKEIHSEDHP